MKKKHLLVISILTLPLAAFAHVKWFVDFDTTKVPQSIMQVTSHADFWALLVFSTIVIFSTSQLDRKMISFADRPSWAPLLNRCHNYIPRIMRWGTGTFFLILYVKYPYILLTPELTVENPWLRYVHLAIGLMAFFRRTSFISGLGILFLYSYSVQLYGTFHMLDYLIFIGTGVYLIMQSFRPKGVHGVELEFLRFVLCYSFLWGAIEKFMQPELFYQLLTDHAYLAMGLQWEFFVRACGFVELCCVWHIYTGKMGGYAGIAVLGVFVVLAFIPFGMTDFIGHFLFIIPLIAILFTPRKKFLFQTATTNTAAFLLTFFLLMLMGYLSYYILHFQLHPHLHF